MELRVYESSADQKAMHDTKQRNKFMDFNNHFTANVSKLRSQLNEIRHDVMRVISPLDEQQMKLQRLIESISCQLIVLEAYLKERDSEHIAFDLEDKNTIKETYKTQFEQLRKDLFSGYKERLKSRDHVFDMKEDAFVKLDEIKRAELLQKYSNAISLELNNHRDEFLRKIDSINLRSSLKELKEWLRNECNRLNDELDKIIEEKIPHGTTYNNEEEKFFSRRKGLEMEKEKYHEAIEQSLPVLCLAGKLEEIKDLIRKDRKLLHTKNILGELPLHCACQGGHYEVVKHLLSLGADPCLLDERIIYRGERLSAYHYACRLESTAILELLCNINDDKIINILSAKGRTLLHTAVFYNRPRTVRWLLDKTFSKKPAIIDWLFDKEKINVNIQDDFTGATPLHLAAWRGFPQITSDLLNYGANIRVKNRSGDTPLLQAVLYRQVEVLKVFFNHGYCLTLEDSLKLFGNNTVFSKATCRLFARAIEEAYLSYADTYLSTLRTERNEKLGKEQSLDKKQRESPTDLMDRDETPSRFPRIEEEMKRTQSTIKQSSYSPSLFKERLVIQEKESDQTAFTEEQAAEIESHAELLMQESIK